MARKVNAVPLLVKQGMLKHGDKLELNLPRNRGVDQSVYRASFAHLRGSWAFVKWEHDGEVHSLSVLTKKLKAEFSVPCDVGEITKNWRRAGSQLSLKEEANQFPRTGFESITYPDDVEAEAVMTEGACRTTRINAYERNPKARLQCIAAHGTECWICKFDFGKRYGQIAEGYIHVHHLRPLAEIGEEYVVDPINDLRPVCPNCHAVLHIRKPAYSIEEVKVLLR